METNIISLDELDRAPRCISQSFRKSCAEACVKTLNELNHRSGSPLDVSGIKSKKFELIWNKSVTREILNTWTEQNYTTDHAAVGLSFLLVTKLSEYKVVQRSRTKTGFDYWLAGDQSQCDNDLPFRNAARLEISGIFRGKKADIQRRVQTKLVQTNQSDDTRLPAYVIVIEFSKLTSVFVKKD